MPELVRPMRCTPNAARIDLDRDVSRSVQVARPWLSIIIPARNESGHIQQVVEALGDDHEIIVVDGQSTDDTVAIAERCGAIVLSSAPSRAGQMNHGAAHAQGDVLMFLHADTHVPQQFEQMIRDVLADSNTLAGGFHVRIDGPQRSLRIIERCIAWRSRVRQMPYGDQALFVRANVFRSIDGFPAIPVMEDYEFIRRIRRQGRVGLANGSVLTSARRWQGTGVWKTTVLNQLCVLAWRLGVSADRIVTWRRSRRNRST